MDLAQSVTASIAGVAVLASIANIVFTLYSSRRTREHMDATWLRERRSAVISDWFEDVSSSIEYLSNDLLVAYGKGKVTREVVSGFRELQVKQQRSHIRLMTVADIDLIEAATTLQFFMDNDIQGFPKVGAEADDLRGHHPLIQSLGAITDMHAATINPMRRAYGVSPIGVSTDPAPNSYGR